MLRLIIMILFLPLTIIAQDVSYILTIEDFDNDNWAIEDIEEKIKISDINLIDYKGTLDDFLDQPNLEDEAILCHFIFNGTKATLEYFSVFQENPLFLGKLSSDEIMEGNINENVAILFSKSFPIKTEVTQIGNPRGKINVGKKHSIVKNNIFVPKKDLFSLSNSKHGQHPSNKIIVSSTPKRKNRSTVSGNVNWGEYFRIQNWDTDGYLIITVKDQKNLLVQGKTIKWNHGKNQKNFDNNSSSAVSDDKGRITIKNLYRTSHLTLWCDQQFKEIVIPYRESIDMDLQSVDISFTVEPPKTAVKIFVSRQIGFLELEVGEHIATWEEGDENLELTLSDGFVDVVIHAAEQDELLPLEEKLRELENKKTRIWLGYNSQDKPEDEEFYFLFFKKNIEYLLVKDDFYQRKFEDILGKKDSPFTISFILQQWDKWTVGQKELLLTFFTEHFGTLKEKVDTFFNLNENYNHPQLFEEYLMLAGLSVLIAQFEVEDDQKERHYLNAIKCLKADLDTQDVDFLPNKLNVRNQLQKIRYFYALCSVCYNAKKYFEKAETETQNSGEETQKSVKYKKIVKLGLLAGIKGYEACKNFTERQKIISWELRLAMYVYHLKKMCLQLEPEVLDNKWYEKIILSQITPKSILGFASFLKEKPYYNLLPDTIKTNLESELQFFNEK